jgi:hypothetical protein
MLFEMSESNARIPLLRDQDRRIGRRPVAEAGAVAGVEVRADDAAPGVFGAQPVRPGTKARALCRDERVRREPDVLVRRDCAARSGGERVPLLAGGDRDDDALVWASTRMRCFIFLALVGCSG